MAKSNSSRGRGGGRGRGRGRGGRGGSFSQYNLSKSSRRRKNRTHLSTDTEVPELMDLEESSMASLSKRPNRMMNEVSYTSRHAEKTMAQPLRYKPIEFVKASNVYDPSKDLTDLLRKYKDDFLEDLRNLDMSDEETPANESPKEQNDESDGTGEVAQKEEVQREEVQKGEHNEDKEELEDEEEDEGEKLEVEEIEELQDAELEEPGEKDEISCMDQGPNTEVLGSEIEMKEALEPQTAGTDVLAKENSARSKARSESLEFAIDEEGDPAYVENVLKEDTFSLLQKKLYTEEGPGATEYDPYIAVGKVLMKTHSDFAGQVTASLPKTANYEPDFGFEEVEDAAYADLESGSDSDFEDYMNSVMGDQYKFHESDEDEEGDVIYDYGEKGISYDGPREPATSESDFDDYDVYVSSDNPEKDVIEDVLESEDLNSEEEGLEDILEFARNQQRSFNPMDLQAGGPPRKKGKGKKQRLELSDELDIELRASLMEQFHYQKQAKRQKKIMKKEKQIRDGIEKQDLLLKYDYSIHIQEIKEEFEIFLHNVAKETLSFPPLDGHGNKTIAKVAGHYNMKSAKCGDNGLHQYIKVSKTKKTFRYLPAYDQIGYIMKQRPIFKRTDVKRRTQEEIQKTDGKKERPKRGPRNEAHVSEGDIVGGKAPEIDNDNVGRKLLEKLGWSRGEGLGAVGNKGISVPLTATVKTSKTGLK